jgi:hypothetical protein
MTPFVLLDDHLSAPDAQNRLLFSNGVEEVVCKHSASLLQSLTRLDELKQQGFYLVGFISYEAGLFLNQPFIIDVKEVDDAFPLLHFIAFKTCTRLTASEVCEYLENFSVSCHNRRVNNPADFPRLDRGIHGSRSGIGSLDPAVKPREVGMWSLPGDCDRIQ